VVECTQINFETVIERTVAGCVAVSASHGKEGDMVPRGMPNLENCRNTYKSRAISTSGPGDELTYNILDIVNGSGFNRREECRSAMGIPSRNSLPPAGCIRVEHLCPWRQLPNQSREVAGCCRSCQLHQPEEVQESRIANHCVRVIEGNVSLRRRFAPSRASEYLYHLESVAPADDQCTYTPSKTG
jgi:hypothetical protein